MPNAKQTSTDLVKEQPRPINHYPSTIFIPQRIVDKITHRIENATSTLQMENFR